MMSPRFVPLYIMICKWLFPPSLAMLLLASLSNGVACGEDYDIIPSLSVKEEYNDNMFFSSNARTSAFVTFLAPRLELAKRNERLDASLSAGVEEILYNDQGGLVTALNQNYRGQASYFLDPLLRLSLDSSYTINSRPDRNIEQNGIVIDAVRRDRQSHSLGADYTLSEKNALGLSYLYEQEDYSNRPQSNNWTHGAGLAFVHDLRGVFPSAKARANLSFARYGFSDSTTDNYSVTVGLDYSISETWDVTADVGGRFTHSVFDIANVVVSPQLTNYRIVNTQGRNDGLGWVGKIALSVRGEVDNGSLVLSRNVSVSSSRSGASENNSLDLNYRHDFTPELSGTATVGYQRSSSSSDEFNARTIDEDFIRLNTGLRYEFTRNMAVDASYAYTKAIYKQSDTTADRNSFVVSFTVRHPFLDLW